MRRRPSPRFFPVSLFSGEPAAPSYAAITEKASELLARLDRIKADRRESGAVKVIGIRQDI